MTKMSSWQAKAPEMAVAPRVALMFQKINVLLGCDAFLVFLFFRGAYYPEQASSGKERRSAHF